MKSEELGRYLRPGSVLSKRKDSFPPNPRIAKLAAVLQAYLRQVR